MSVFYIDFVKKIDGDLYKDSTSQVNAIHYVKILRPCLFECM